MDTLPFRLRRLYEILKLIYEERIAFSNNINKIHRISLNIFSEDFLKNHSLNYIYLPKVVLQSNMLFFLATHK